MPEWMKKHSKISLGLMFLIAALIAWLAGSQLKGYLETHPDSPVKPPVMFVGSLRDRPPYQTPEQRLMNGSFFIIFFPLMAVSLLIYRKFLKNKLSEE